MAAVAEMGEVDEIHSNDGSIKDGASVNGDGCDYKETTDDEPNESMTNTSDQEQISSSDHEKSDDDALSDSMENGGEEEEADEEEEEDTHEEEENTDKPEKMDADDDDDDQVHEINSEGEEEGTDTNQPSSPTTDVANGLNSSDEVIIEPETEGEQTSENSKSKSDNSSIEINDCDDVVVLDDKDPIENESASVNNRDTEVKTPDGSDVIAVEDTPVKKKKKVVDSGPPRRSSRNLNKERKSYVEDEEEEEKALARERERQREREREHENEKPKEVHSSEESDIEEVMPQDPLAGSDPAPAPPENKPAKKSRMSGSTIVVKDTKCLAEIASKSAGNNNNKKEPTLVIIDTNSILSGRGPVPISQKPQISSSPISNSAYPMLPMALPAQGVYPANMRATITPIPMTPPVLPPTPPKPTPPPPPPPPPVLPTLTDDMFVVEAPSFIVPYVYEKPPMKDLREFVRNLEKEIAEQKKKDEEERKSQEDGKKEEKEKSGEEGNDKEDEEKMDVDDEDDDSKKIKKSVENEKENKDDVHSLPISSTSSMDIEVKKSPATYFDSPLGKFFMGIGYSLVQEVVQGDLLKQQKRKRDREGAQNPETLKTINSLMKNLEFTKENNEPYHMETKKCEFCSFKTESTLAMAFHLETPHMKNYVYRCNFCPYEVRSPHDILFHMEVLHGVRGRLERAPAFHQCPNCPFEDNQKGKLSRHLVTCARKFKPDRNLEPPADYEPPAKIPRAPRMKQQSLTNAAAVYQAMARNPQYQMMSKMAAAGTVPVMQRGRGRPSLGNSGKQAGMRASNLIYKPTSMSGGSVLLPTNYQLSGNPLFQVVGGQEMCGRIGPGGPTTFLPGLSATPNTVTIQSPQQQPQSSSLNKIKPVQQPSISITPLPRASTTSGGLTITKPGDSNPKNSFVICEICDGYIKDLEQLRNHMQWIHKVKIHPKMIYNRPPLNCQKCQFRFFTDQGLERHLLGSHGLVTSSMQEAANRSKDAGRCPVCGRVYQWKLLNHVARDHNMTLKPAHLSYKCTVCTATFGMYKQFESHVYSAHSVVAKRVMDKKNSSCGSSSVLKNDSSVLKPLKINDEITIIPQPAKPANGASGSSKDETPSTSGTSISARNSIGFSNGNPGTSKGSSGDGLTGPSLSRSERLNRRKTSSQTDN